MSVRLRELGYVASATQLLMSLFSNIEALAVYCQCAISSLRPQLYFSVVIMFYDSTAKITVSILDTISAILDTISAILDTIF